MTVLRMAMALSLLTGCVGAGGVQARLGAGGGEVKYEVGEHPDPVDRQPGSVSLASYTVEPRLPPETTVKRTGGYFLPLLFVNLWKGEYLCTVGAAQVLNDYVQFMRESFTEELRRNAKYELAESDGALQLEVKVQKIEMNAPVRESGNMFFLGIAWGYTSSLSAGPVDVVITGEMVAQKDGMEEQRKTVVGKARVLPRIDKSGTMASYTAAMLKGLSAAVESFNDAAVSAVNGL